MSRVQMVALDAVRMLGTQVARRLAGRVRPERVRPA
jgi:hypothetical protein